MNDLRVVNHGSVWTIEPLSDEAKAWMEENVVDEGWNRLGDAYAGDWRPMRELLQALVLEGFQVAL